MFIDTHAHLYYPDILEEIEAVLARAMEAGVDYIIVPAINHQSSLDVIELVQKHDMLYGAVGIHPAELADFREKHLHEIDVLSSSDKIVAIGEIGLDYCSTRRGVGWKPHDRELQHYVLKSQLQIAKSRNLPVIIHNRESSDDLMEIISEISAADKSERFKGQFHSFSGGMNMALECIEMGFHISFTGNLTYKPNDKTLAAHEIVRAVPLEKLLLETDTPYLPPLPYRGKRNEPAYIKHTAEKIAELKGIALEEAGRVTSENARKLFGLK